MQGRIEETIREDSMRLSVEAKEHLEVGNLDLAVKRYQEAIELNSQIPDEDQSRQDIEFLERCYYELGIVYRRLGNYWEEFFAIEMAKSECFRLKTFLGDDTAKLYDGNYDYLMAFSCLNQGFTDLAITYFTQTIEHFESFRHSEFDDHDWARHIYAQSLVKVTELTNVRDLAVYEKALDLLYEQTLYRDVRGLPPEQIDQILKSHRLMAYCQSQKDMLAAKKRKADALMPANLSTFFGSSEHPSKKQKREDGITLRSGKVIGK